MAAFRSDPIRLYILCGLSFAGKSTLADALARRFGWTVIAIDAINRERGLGSSAAPITPVRWDETYAEAYHRAGEALAAGKTVIFDAVSFTRTQRDDLRAIAATQGASGRVISSTYQRLSAGSAGARIGRPTRVSMSAMTTSRTLRCASSLLPLTSARCGMTKRSL